MQEKIISTLGVNRSLKSVLSYIIFTYYDYNLGINYSFISVYDNFVLIIRVNYYVSIFYYLECI